jgi:hypothetical protein
VRIVLLICACSVARADDMRERAAEIARQSPIVSMLGGLSDGFAAIDSLADVKAGVRDQAVHLALPAVAAPLAADLDHWFYLYPAGWFHREYRRPSWMRIDWENSVVGEVERRIMRKHHDELLWCYEKFQGTRAARVTLTFVAGPTRAMGPVVVISSTDVGGLEPCLAATVRRMDFVGWALVHLALDFRSAYVQ